jgi:beta-galactosidase
VLYVRESLWVDRRLHRDFPDRSPGRALGAPLHSALGWYEALSAVGLHPKLGEIREYDFDAADCNGRTIVFSHQVAVPSALRNRLREFVRRGGRLIVDGLTSYYDEHAHCVMMSGFPFADLFGGRVQEVSHVASRFDVVVDRAGGDAAAAVPGHLFRGAVRPEGGRPIAVEAIPAERGVSGEKTVLGVSHHYGDGKVLWIPSCLGLGARVAGPLPLAEFARRAVAEPRSGPPLSFETACSGVLLRALETDDTLVVVFINKNAEPAEVAIRGLPPAAGARRPPEIWFADGEFTAGQITGQSGVRLEAEQTLVVAFDTR